MDCQIEYKYLRPKKAKELQEWYEKEFCKKTTLTAVGYADATILPLKRCNDESLLFGSGGGSR